MKRQVISLISLLSLLLVAGSAIAQTVHVRAKVPFNFAVGKKTFAAGTYEVGTISKGDDKMLLLQAREGNSSLIMGSNATEIPKPADKTKLVFNRYDDTYFLSEIWVAGEHRGRQLPKSSREKELGKEMAKDFTERRVEVLASLY